MAARHARKVIADHLLIVFETAACQNHRLPRLDIDRFLGTLSPHSENFLGGAVLDQLPRRSLVEDLDRPLLHQPLEEFPSVGIAVSRAVMEFVDAVRAGQVREFDADRLMLMLLRVTAEPRKPVVVAAHFLGPNFHHWFPARCRDRTAPANRRPLDLPTRCSGSLARPRGCSRRAHLPAPSPGSGLWPRDRGR